MRVRAPSLQVGDYVRYKLMPRPRKGRSRFSSPCRVTARRGPVSFELEGGVRVHAERLSKCSPPADVVSREPSLDREAPDVSVDVADGADLPSSEPVSPQYSEPERRATPAPAVRRRGGRRPEPPPAGGDAVVADGISAQSPVVMGSGDRHTVDAPDDAAPEGEGERVEEDVIDARASSSADMYRTRSGRLCKKPDRFGFEKRGKM